MVNSLAIRVKPRPRIAVVSVACALYFSCGAVVAQPANVRLVNHVAPPGGNGQTWATAYNDLHEALAEAQNDPGIHAIWIAKGSYRPSTAGLPDPLAATFRLRNGLALYGGFAGGETQLEERNYEANQTVLSGEIGELRRAWHVVTAANTDETSVVDGLTVMHGYATEASPHGPQGGGILIIGGVATIRNSIIMSNAATLEGSGPPINAGGGGVSGTGVFQSCIFANNWTFGYGGGIRGGGTFAQCLFVDNSAYHGGGGFSGDGTFTDCEFEGNSASIGALGGGAVEGGGHFVRCDFINNYGTFDAGAASGGGTFIECTLRNNAADTGALGFGTFTLIDCVVENNWGHHTGFYAAGIITIGTTFIGNDIFRDCSVDAESCIFSGSFDYFDPLFAQSGDIRLINSVVAGNATRRGIIEAGVQRTVEVINSTIVFNGWSGSAGYPHPAITLTHASASARIYNSVLWDNAGQSEEDQIAVPAGTLDIQNSIVQGWTGSLGGTGNFGFDPMFADGWGRVSAGSPAIDAGNNGLIAATITTDVDGNPRFHDDPGTPDNGMGTSPLVDIGAFEFQGITCYANCDGSTAPPILNVDDFTCFINRFAQGHPLVNCDGSTNEPVLNVDDFTCFINAFAAGCP